MILTGMLPGLSGSDPVMSVIEQGEMRLREGKFEAARETFERAMGWAAAAFGQTSTRFARANDDMAAVCLAQKKYDEAERFARRSIAAYQAAFGGESRCVARVLGLLGDVHFQRGKLNEARAAYARSLSAFEYCDGTSNTVERGCAMRALGRCLIAMGREREAKPYMVKSFRILQLAYGKRRQFTPLDRDERPRISGAIAI